MAGTISTVSSTEAAIRDFKVITSQRTRVILDILPGLMMALGTMLIFMYWYVYGGFDIPTASMTATIIIGVLFAREEFVRYPETLLTIYRRKLLRTQDGSDVEDAVQQFLASIRTQLRLNIRYVMGIIGILIMGWMQWLFQSQVILEFSARLQTDPFSTLFAMAIRAGFLAIGYFAGIILWDFVVIGQSIHLFGKTFEFDLQIEHPDGCGGLRPLGDYCLTMALGMAPILFLIGGWLTLINVFDPALYRLDPARVANLSATLQILLIVVVVVSLVSFFQPLTSVHAAMLRYRSRMQRDLDDISQRIHTIATHLRVDAEQLTPEQGKELESKIEFLMRVYNRNSRVPTWPFSTSHLVGLASTQVMPLIGFVSSAVTLGREIGILK